MWVSKFVSNIKPEGVREYDAEEGTQVEEEVRGAWRKFRNVDSHDLYSAPNVTRCSIKQSEMGGTCNTYGEMNNVNTVLVGKAERRRQVGKFRRRWEENFKVGHEERRCETWT